PEETGRRIRCRVRKIIERTGSLRELPVLSSIPEIFCRILISPAEKPCKLTAAVIEYSWFIRRRCENGYLKNHFNYYFRYRLYRAVRDHPFTGRKISRTRNDQRSRRHILGTEQRTFYGGSACEVHEVSGCAFYRACARSES